MHVTEDATTEDFELVEEASSSDAPEDEDVGVLPQVEAPEGPIGKAITFVFGVVGLVFGLAVLASTPVLQFMTLGWMLEAEGRLGRGESWRTWLPGLRKAARIGSSVIGVAILTLPLLILHYYYLDARLIAAASDQTTLLSRLRLGFAIPIGFQYEDPF